MLGVLTAWNLWFSMIDLATLRVNTFCDNSIFHDLSLLKLKFDITFLILFWKTLFQCSWNCNILSNLRFEKGPFHTLPYCKYWYLCSIYCSIFILQIYNFVHDVVIIQLDNNKTLLTTIYYVMFMFNKCLLRSYKFLFFHCYCVMIM